MTNNWIICPACRGNGTHVNPNIDAGGISAEDFYDDPDFMEQYMDGTYDVACDKCHGDGKIRESKLTEMYQAVEDRKLSALENGDLESYLVAGDLRF